MYAWSNSPCMRVQHATLSIYEKTNRGYLLCGFTTLEADLGGYPTIWHAPNYVPATQRTHTRCAHACLWQEAAQHLVCSIVRSAVGYRANKNACMCVISGNVYINKCALLLVEIRHRKFLYTDGSLPDCLFFRDWLMHLIIH